MKLYKAEIIVDVDGKVMSTFYRTHSDNCHEALNQIFDMFISQMEDNERYDKYEILGFKIEEK